MNWKKECFKSFRLYIVTDVRVDDPNPIYKIELALKGGAEIIQLRSKHISDQAFLHLAKLVRRLTERMRKLFIVNDRVDLALIAEADGVHLGQEDMPIKGARQLFQNTEMIIGCSTHSLDQAEQAVREGADYIGFGPLFQTPSKPTYEPLGLETVMQVHEKISIPIVCIGGIHEGNIDRVVKAGAHRIAVIRAVFDARDPKTAAQHLREKIFQFQPSHS